MCRLHQYVSTKNIAHYCNCKKYPRAREIHMIAIPRARSREAFSDIPQKRVAANKKKQFVWTDDKAQLLLAVLHGYKIKHLVEGTCD